MKKKNKFKPHRPQPRKKRKKCSATTLGPAWGQPKGDTRGPEAKAIKRGKRGKIGKSERNLEKID